MSVEKDFTLAQELIEAKLLQPIDADHLRKERASAGAILISCGDKDRFKQHFGGCSGITDVHSICLNGGGVLLAEGIDPLRQQILLEECRESLELKGLRFIFDLAHFPCGKCAKLGIDLRHTILNTLQGKNILKKSISPALLHGVLPLISIDWREASSGRERGVMLYGVKRQDAGTIAKFGMATQRHASTYVSHVLSHQSS